ncbi:hypothetical protein EDB92DRAFT_1569458 [Lactarius akahatsu]|uniref:Uncharacterized protein n=1 Tax=Lactarius akahatsu TaxID=416441 RepID=A0AAD4L7J9_9AGAM|nr:hypothetical protein EDB92DRAFT_1569458 [Lactarius akahatsu]
MEHGPTDFFLDHAFVELNFDVACVFGPFSPYYVTRHPPPRPFNPSIHRHGRESRRAFVLSTWLIDARICGSRGLIHHHITVITTSLIGDAFLIIFSVASGVTAIPPVNLARLSPTDTVFLSSIYDWLIVTSSYIGYPWPLSAVSLRPLDRRRVRHSAASRPPS